MHNMFGLTCGEIGRLSAGLFVILRCDHLNIFLSNVTLSGNHVHVTSIIIRTYEKHYQPQMNLFISHCSFTKHSILPHFSTSKIGNSAVLVKTSMHCELSNTNISQNDCTGLMVLGSNIIISGRVNILGNRAYSGGGMLLCSSAILYFVKNTTLAMHNNSAELTGGGINVETECILNSPQCFFQLTSELSKNKSLSWRRFIYM